MEGVPVQGTSLTPCPRRRSTSADVRPRVPRVQRAFQMARIAEQHVRQRRGLGYSVGWLKQATWYDTRAPGAVPAKHVTKAIDAQTVVSSRRPKKLAAEVEAARRRALRGKKWFPGRKKIACASRFRTRSPAGSSVARRRAPAGRRARRARAALSPARARDGGRRARARRADAPRVRRRARASADAVQEVEEVARLGDAQQQRDVGARVRTRVMSGFNAQMAQLSTNALRERARDMQQHQAGIDAEEACAAAKEASGGASREEEEARVRVRDEGKNETKGRDVFS